MPAAASACPFDRTPLREACREEIAKGLIACQVAVGYDDEIVYRETFGEALDDTRFWVASATKPIVASAVWVLMGEGELEVERRVADYIPEFGKNGKQDVTVEQVLLMTSGFPNALMPREVAVDPQARAAQLAGWTLDHEPGCEYHYHAGSAHWVLAEFYQGLLHNTAGVFDADVLHDATTHIRSTLPDAMMKLPANRTLGVVLGAGFGTTWGKSNTAFGWPGMGGQIGFAEPATGMSFAFLQMGDTDQVRPFVRGTRLSNIALELGRA